MINFIYHLIANNVALQVEIACCAYYHFLAQQIFMLQNVKATSPFCNMKKFLAQEGGNTRDKPSQLATQHCEFGQCASRRGMRAMDASHATQDGESTCESHSY